MAISDLPILSMLRTRMSWHQERQRLLAENVANADTPNFRPHDLAKLSFDKTAPHAPASLSLIRTSPSHLAGDMAAGGSDFEAAHGGRFEVKPGGNAVNLEDQMMKVAANQMDYQTVTSLYARSLGLIKTALGKS